MSNKRINTNLNSNKKNKDWNITVIVVPLILIPLGFILSVKGFFENSPYGMIGYILLLLGFAYPFIYPLLKGIKNDK